MLNKPLLAILNIFVESKAMDKVVDELVKMPEVLDVYEVTGEFDIVALISTENLSSFRNFLKNKVLKIEGVKSTVTSIILSTPKKNGVVTSFEEKQ
ncbi:MAG: Lrp/AsnC ligand binding domain-containing protein [Candidatus Bathyarchaeia archaeon]|nr:Lrp/AsnC ligand binding domain-containing protein [Candidatus Bathyarchaeota archaeon]